jgi:tetratricopeptide (TPR) repeat protein
MQRVGLRNRWLAPALVCALILAGASSLAVWRSTRYRQPGLIEQGQAAYDHQDWPAAARKAREQLRQDRNDPIALRLLGRALYRQGLHQAAAGIFERLTPETMTAEDYLLVGQSFIRSQKVDLAIEEWRKGLQLDANHFESRMALEQTLFRLDRLAEAEREAELLLARPGREALAALLRGQIRAQLSDPAGAAKALHLAMRSPDQWQSMVEPDFFRKQLARCLLQTGQPASARDQLDRLNGQNRDPETCWLLSRCDLQEGVSTNDVVSFQARSYRKSHPMEPEPAPFVGEAQCAACHPGTFREQNKSRHARTFSRKEQFPTISIPQRPITDPANAQVSHAFHQRGDGLEVDTRVDGQVYQTIVDYAFGSGDRGLTMVGHDPEGRSLEYRLSYYPRRVGWDVTTGQPLQPGRQSALYQGHSVSSDDVRHCMFCHNTNPHAILTSTGPESLDRAIGCERCHGPGGNHLKVASSKKLDSNHDADLAIARPSLASGPAIVGLCAECHSQMKLGITPTQGSPNSIRFQGATLTWSRCYTESDNKLDCVTCHNPHRDAETTAQWYVSRCLQCHPAGGATVNRTGSLAGKTEASGQRSCPVQPASGCIECHMPTRESSTAHTVFTDHFIRVHPPIESGTTPRP